MQSTNNTVVTALIIWVEQLIAESAVLKKTWQL